MSEIRTRPRARIVARPLIQAACPDALDARLVVQPVLSAITATGASGETAQAKLAALKAISGRSCVVRAAEVAAPLKELASATTAVEIRQAEQALSLAVENSHRTVVTHGLTLACAEASRAAGFDAVETVTGYDGSMRVIATQASGNALVSEIRLSGADMPAQVETEVLGSGGPECTKILDRFDAALESQGVRFDESQARRPTGGRASTQASRDFLASRPRKPAAVKQRGRPGWSGSRRDRLRAQSAQRASQKS